MSAAHPARGSAGSSRWWLTIFPTDDDPVHLAVDDEAEAERVLVVMRERFPGLSGRDYSLREMPATWACDGRDGCMAVS